MSSKTQSLDGMSAVIFAADINGKWHPWLRAVPGILVFVGYYLGAKLGLAMTFQPHPVSVMWPPNSILLAALLLSAPRSWWFLLAWAFPAHLLAELQGEVPLRMVLCWYISNCSEALIGATTTRCFLGGPLRFDRLNSIAVLLLCGALLGPFLSSFLDAGFVALNHFGQQSYWTVWRMRFCSNVFTSLTLTTAIIAWGTHRRGVRDISIGRLIEAVLIFGGLLIVSVIVFCGEKAGPATSPALLYAPLPFLLWTAVRFGCTGISTANLIVALLAIWGAVHDHGPFASPSPEQNALSIQVFFAVVAMALMFLAASIEERAKAEERFTKAFSSSPDAMLISRLKDGRVIEINDRWEKILGYARAETIGQNLFKLNICTSQANHERFLAAIGSPGHFQDLELTLRAKSGEIISTLVSGDTDEIAGEHCWIFSVRDFTDRKRAQEAQENLAHASRLAVVGELTAMVAHEVNQPLGAILSNAEAAELLLELPEPPLQEIRQILADIRKNDVRADEAIRRIRGLLRKQETQLRPLDLNEALSDVLRLVAGDALKRHVSIHKDFGPDLPPASADRVHLQHVVLNLVLNAMDAMNDTCEAGRQVTVKSRQNGDAQLEVSVIDGGRGIGPHELPRLFDSFFTTKKDGMGIGLSIARSIIEAHHGRIWAENNPNGGATFHFTIPGNKPAMAPMGKKA